MGHGRLDVLYTGRSGVFSRFIVVVVEIWRAGGLLVTVSVEGIEEQTGYLRGET